MARHSLIAVVVVVLSSSSTTVLGEPSARFEDVSSEASAGAEEPIRVTSPPVEAPSPSCPRADHRLARAERLLGQRRTLMAIGELTRAITEDPRCGTALLQLARLRSGLGDYAEAELLYGKAVRLHAVADEALRARSLMRRKQGKTREALRDLEAYAGLAPDDASRLETLASVYVELKSWVAALAVYRRILHLHVTAARDTEAADARVKVRALSLLAAEADPVMLGASGDRSWVRRAMAQLSNE